MLTPEVGGASIFLTREVSGGYKFAGVCFETFQMGSSPQFETPGKDVIR
jgi:hypothetical protein